MSDKEFPGDIGLDPESEVLVNAIAFGELADGRFMLNFKGANTWMTEAEAMYLYGLMEDALMK